jgi:hypothetical protein
LVREQFEQQEPNSYADIVKAVITMLQEDEYDSPDPMRIHQIDDGDYQGTLVFVIASGGYQPSTYWYVKVNYGSCSGCDTLEAIRDDFDEKKKMADLMTLALHIVQGLKEMGENE